VNKVDSCAMIKSPSFIPNLETMHGISINELKKNVIEKIFYDIADRVYGLTFGFSPKKGVKL